MILVEGGGGLFVVFDMLIFMGCDFDDECLYGEVGYCGVAIDSVVDMDILFCGIDLVKIMMFMMIFGLVVLIFCMYVVAVEC